MTHGLEHLYLLYLFLAYSAMWVVMFGFLYRMIRRARQLEREVALLKNQWMGGEPHRPEGTSVTPIVPGPGV